MAPDYKTWKRLLDAALAESDPAKLMLSLTTAEHAIAVRKQELLDNNSEAAEAERGALDSAAQLIKEIRTVEEQRGKTQRGPWLTRT